MNSRKLKLTFGIAAGLFVATGAQAQLHMPSALGGSSSASSSDAMAAQDSLVKTFIGSQTEVLAAQALLSRAYDLKDQADLLDAEQKALQSGSLDTDALKKTVDISTKANAAIAAQQGKQTVLSAEGKQYYAQSLPHFAKGVIGTQQVIAQAEKFTSAAKGSMSGLSALTSGMTKLKAGAYVARATPSYAKTLFNVFRKTVSISRSNNIAVPSDATAALGAL